MQQLSDMLRQRHCVDALCILGMICIQAVRLDRFLLTRQSSPFMSPSKPLFRLPCSVNKQPSIGAVPPVPLLFFFQGFPENLGDCYRPVCTWCRIPGAAKRSADIDKI